MWTSLRRLLGLRGSFGRGVATLVTGTGVAQIIVIATAPILTRLYDPSDFGIYAVAISILSLLLTITCLRYEFAIPLPESSQVAANLLALSLLAALGMSIAAAVGLLIVGPRLVEILGAPGLAPYVLLLPLAQLGAGVGAAFSGLALRTRSFASIAAARVTQGVVLVVTQLSLGALGLGPAGLLAGDAIGRSAGSTQLAYSAWRSDRHLFRQVTWSGMAAAARRYRRFPLVSSWSAFLATLGQQAPVLLFVGFYGVDAGGEYALATRIGALPLSLVAGAVSQVFVAETANLARTDRLQVRYLFRRTTRSLALVGIVPVILVMVLAPLLAGVVFGTAWATVGLYLAILAPSFYLEFVVGATGDVLLVLERQGLQLAREVVRFVLIAGAIPLAAMLGLSDIGAIALLSLARCATYLAYGLVSWVAVVQFTAGRSIPPANQGEDS
jgi:O-antigen/teichoic acid export membrane protein